MSARWSTGSPLACSGAMYSIVPTTEPSTVSPRTPVGSSAPDRGAPGSVSGRPADLAIPKSMIIA